MEQRVIRKVLQVDGMTCAGCEVKIERQLAKMEGVLEAKAAYSISNVYVTYDANAVKLGSIIEAIEKLDYTVKNKPGNKTAANSRPDNKEAEASLSVNQLIAIGIILFALYTIIQNTVGFNFIPEVSQNMGYGLLFAVGLLTSLHCIAMCGGINLSQCVSYKYESSNPGKFEKMTPSLLYNSGRVVSYTAVGGLVGALGSVVSFSGMAKGIVAVISGVFMVIMGLNMLNLFPWLRKLNPRMPRIFGNKVHDSSGKHGPFVVGLLNGLMPCGPLQAMQIYALGTGSFAAGAASMFVFSLGTVPLMFGFGAVSSFLSGKFTKRMMKVSAVLVMILGVVMLNRGLSLSGIDLASSYAAPAAKGIVARIEGDVQVVTTPLESGRYKPFTVQKGIPVKWTITADAQSLNGCNAAVTIPKYGITKQLEPGDNLIEFTPEEEGTISYSCWMGMIRSSIRVVPDIAQVTSGTIEVNNITQTASQNGDSPAAGRCGPAPEGFENGKIPTDNILVARVENLTQEVEVTVNNQGYTPAVFVIQRDIPVKIKFKLEDQNICNGIVVFPEYQGVLDLSAGDTETPYLTPVEDFSFQCGTGMLHGYVKVVDDVNKVDLDEVRNDVENFVPPAGAPGCH